MPGFNTWNVGEVLSAASLNTYMVQQNIVIKASDTARSSTTTLTADPHLTLAVTSNTNYLLEGLIRYSAAHPTGGMVFGWTGPSGATMDWDSGAADIYDAQGTPNMSLISKAIGDTGTAVGIGSGGSGNPFVRTARPLGLLRTAASGGSITMRWAQQASTSDATVVRAGSWLRITKVS